MGRRSCDTWLDHDPKTQDPEIIIYKKKSIRMHQS